MSRIFISHSSKDNAAAESMKAWLEKQGYRSLFLDFDPEVGIEAGTEWKQVLYRKLRQSQAVIALVTPNWLASQWCDREVTLADEKGKSIFVVKVEPCDWRAVFPHLQRIDLTRDREQGYDHLTKGLIAKGLHPKDSFDWDDPDGSRCPYPGLQYFDTKDAAIFFGRDDEIEDSLTVLNQLRKKGWNAPRFLLFLGASGSGKSSLVRAGVLPRLHKAASDCLPLRPFRPQKDPLEKLALVLAEGFKAFQQTRNWKGILEELTAAAEADPPEGKLLTRLASDLQVAADRPEATTLLTIDQAEELIGYSASEATNLFLRLLRAALEVADRQLMVLATMRSDFLAEFQTHPVLAGFDYESVTVDPMPLENVPEIVERPAQLTDVRFEAGLVSRLQADAATRDALPLLAFTLRRLYDRYADDKLLQLKEYKDLGGLEASVRQVADGVLEEMKPTAEELEALRSAFVPRMVRIGEDSQYARCLAYRDAMPEQAEILLKRFVDARLLVSDRDREGRETLEVAHEALLRTWPQLIRWLEEDRSKLGIVAKLKRATQDWVQSKKSAEQLVHREGLLQVARELIEQEERFTPEEGSEEKAYLDACIEAQHKRERERKRLFRGAIASLSIVLATVSGLSLWALHNASEVRRKDTELLLDIAKTIASNSHSILTTEEDRSRAMFEVFRARNLIDGVVNIREDVLSEIWYALHASTTNLRHRQILDEHSASILAVEFNPVGNTLASSSDDGRLGLWDSQGKFVAIEGHKDAVSTVEYSPDGKILASASDDGVVRLWDSQGNPLATLEGHTDRVRDVTFSPDGQTLASSSDDGLVRLWDSQGNPLATLEGHTNGVRAVAFSPDGQTLASASLDGTVRLWQRNGTPLNTLEGHSQRVTDVEFSPNSAILASASADGTVRLWRRDGAPLDILEGHSQIVTDVEFSPDGEIIASASHDETVRLWEIDGALKVTLEGHSLRIFAIEFSPDGEFLASISLDKTVRLWGRDGTHIATLEGHSLKVQAVSISQDSQTVATASQDGTVRLWQRDGTPLTKLEGHLDDVWSVQFSPNGELIASASFDKTIRLWQRNGILQATLEGHSDSVRALQFSPDGETIASASWDRTVRLWQRDGSLLSELEGHSDRVLDVQFSHDGEFLASASKDDTARLWQSDGTHIATLEGHSGDVKEVRFSPDGEIVATASFDNTVGLWSAKDGTLITTLEGHTNWVRAVEFSPDGAIIASASNDGTVRLWHRDGTPLDILEGHLRWVNVSFSPDGERIATGGDDNNIRLWDREGTELAILEGHNDSVWSIQFGPDGEVLASVSRDGTVRLWKADDGTPIGNFPGHPDGALALNFDPGGELLVTGDTNGVLRLWHLEMDRLVAHACRQLHVNIQVTDRLEDADREFCQKVVEEYPQNPWEPLQ